MGSRRPRDGAVYTLVNVKRGVPEVSASVFDVRLLLRALYYLNDRKPLEEVKLSLVQRLVSKAAIAKVRGIYLEELLHDSKLAQ